MEVASPKTYVLPHPFSVVLESLPKLKRVDSHSSGFSPVTVRWLTKKNTFINLGLTEKDKVSCELARNNNSFGVTDEELEEAFESIAEHVKNVHRS